MKSKHILSVIIAIGLVMLSLSGTIMITEEHMPQSADSYLSPADQMEPPASFEPGALHIDDGLTEGKYSKTTKHLDQSLKFKYLEKVNNLLITFATENYIFQTNALVHHHNLTELHRLNI